MSGLTRRGFLKYAGVTAAAGLVSSCRGLQYPEGERPNFLFILVDDLGWTDLGCYGRHPRSIFWHYRL